MISFVSNLFNFKAAIEASDMNLKGINKANNPNVIPYGVPMTEEDEPEGRVPAPPGPDVAASVVLPQSYNESKDEKAKTEQKQSKLVFIGFCIGFVVVVVLFVKLVMIWLSVLEHIDEDTI